MASLKRDVITNVVGTIVATPLLLAISWGVSQLSADSGVYLTVAKSVDSYGVTSVVTIKAENASRVGFAPLEAAFPSDSRLQAAGVRSSTNGPETLLDADGVRWSGRLPAKANVAFVLVYKGVPPTINPEAAFSASYSDVDSQGFAVSKKALIRSDGEASAARLLLVVKWLAAVVGLFLLIMFGRWGYGRLQNKAPAKG